MLQHVWLCVSEHISTVSVCTPLLVLLGHANNMQSISTSFMWDQVHSHQLLSNMQNSEVLTSIPETLQLLPGILTETGQICSHMPPPHTHTHTVGKCSCCCMSSWTKERHFSTPGPWWAHSSYCLEKFAYQGGFQIERFESRQVCQSACAAGCEQICTRLLDYVWLIPLARHSESRFHHLHGSTATDGGTGLNEPGAGVCCCCNRK